MNTRPAHYEPWAMEALAILARRLAPIAPAPATPDGAADPGPLARNIDSLIAERTQTQ